MSNRTRSILKAIAVIIVILAVAIRLGWVSISALDGYNFWMVVIAFGTILIAGR
jgi:hypothetical protein